MDEADETGAFAPDLSDAVAAQSEVAIAPAAPEQAVVDSTDTTDSLPAPAAPAWHSQLGLHGFDGLSEADAIARVRDIAAAGGQSYEQAQYYAQQNQRLQQQLQELQQASLAAHPQPAPKQPESPKLPWEPVKIDNSYLDYIDPATRDWYPNTPLEVIKSAQRQRKALQDLQEKFYSDPQSFLTPMIEDRAQALLSPLQEKVAALEAQYVAQQRQQQIQELLAPHTKQFFVQDANGQVQRDQFGNPVLTQIGTDFNNATIIAQKLGFNDPHMLSVIGAITAERNELQRRLAAMQAPAAPAIDPRQQHDAAIYANTKSANGANRLASRANTLNAGAPAAAPPQNEHTSLDDELRQSYRQLVGTGLG